MENRKQWKEAILCDGTRMDTSPSIFLAPLPPGEGRFLLVSPFQPRNLARFSGERRGHFDSNDLDVSFYNPNGRSRMLRRAHVLPLQVWKMSLESSSSHVFEQGSCFVSLHGVFLSWRHRPSRSEGAGNEVMRFPVFWSLNLNSFSWSFHFVWLHFPCYCIPSHWFTCLLWPG